jgi:hypothetical protein
MTEDKDRKIIEVKSGIFNDLALRVKLILRLIADPRVNPLLKLLPLGSVIYLIIPDIAPGPIDDVAVIWLGAYLFVELCPPDVVEEHMQALRKTAPAEWREAGMNEDEVIEAEFWERKEGDAPIARGGDSSEK